MKKMTLTLRSKLVFASGDGTPLQYSCLENPMDGGAWWAAVRGVMKSLTQLDHVTEHALIKWLSCTDDVTAHALMTWLIRH